MKYGMCIDDGEQVRGSRAEISAAVAGALLAVGYDSKEPTAREKAEVILDLADTAAKRGSVQSLDLFDARVDLDQEMQVWRERGGEEKNRDYLIRVGRNSTPYRTDDLTVLKAYITALMVGDGVGVDRAAHLGDLVTVAMAEGGAYSDHKVTELKDGRAVSAWWEGEE